MKKKTFLLALAFAFGLLSGCGGSEAEEETQVPTEDDLPYHFAPGDYEVNEEGFPFKPYEYRLPICNTGEVLTYMCYMPYLAINENAIEQPQVMQLRDMTGITVEYVTLKRSGDTIYEAVMAADDLCDIVAGAKSFVEGAYEASKANWCNLRDYLMYCPNYLYQVTCQPEEGLMFDALYSDENTVPFFYALQDKAVIQTNFMARGDWLDEAYLSNDDIVTWDDLHEMLTLFQVSQDTCEQPMSMPVTIEYPGDFTFTSFDTYPFINYNRLGAAYVVDGKVRFSCMNENDRAFVTMLHQWYEEDLLSQEIIDKTMMVKNYDFYTINEYTDYMLESGRIGYASMTPYEALIHEQETENDPDCRWVPIRKPLRTANQTLHLGGRKNRVLHAAAAVSIRCENIPLAVSWLDFRYSPSGSYALSYGPEGHLWERDENNNLLATAEAMNAGYAGFENQRRYYGLNTFEEVGLLLLSSQFIVPGGDRQFASFTYWDSCSYDGAYEWPKGIELTLEQKAEVEKLSPFVVNYIGSHYFGFIEGSRLLSGWDEYVERLYELGMVRVIEIYQEAYDKYMEQ
ncbi:MAG: hypothetical protein GX111_10930 [Clostridiales bacterium]|jgi:putative aldouronate transport system substrate-binding protein|nr:hypothetical protein [Clostridiales bacterium]